MGFKSQGLSSNSARPCGKPLKSHIFRCLCFALLSSLSSCARGLQIPAEPHKVEEL